MPAPSLGPVAREAGTGAADAPLYLDACAAAPPAEPVIAAMLAAYQVAWANPSSLHGFGFAAADSLERSRQAIAAALGFPASWLTFCSGGTEASHGALLGAASRLAKGRLVISAVEHPAVQAAARQLEAQGWELAIWPVDAVGRVDLSCLERLLAPPTRLVSVIWGQSEVGTLQPIETIGAACRRAGVMFHSDAVQVVGHQLLAIEALPVDLLTFTSHKLQGPRGIGALVARPDLALAAWIGGGGQEAGRRGGTEAVALAAGFAAAIQLAQARLQAWGGRDPLGPERDRLLAALEPLAGVAISGCRQQRLPHHLSLVLSSPSGRPLPGRKLVSGLWRRGLAVSSGTACASGRASGSPVLQAMGWTPEQAGSGLRLSLGPWLTPQQLETLPGRVSAALAAVQAELSDAT
ncbi:MAG: aminotransferase class V-fold PLP-dependent enzyme [Cyanobacteria bacterium]|nr:aminotransferase class V-fold PLP-dependent enzyme [Cyanobacteriota bacterium]